MDSAVRTLVALTTTMTTKVRESSKMLLSLSQEQVGGMGWWKVMGDIGGGKIALVKLGLHSMIETQLRIFL